MKLGNPHVEPRLVTPARVGLGCLHLLTEFVQINKLTYDRQNKECHVHYAKIFMKFIKLRRNLILLAKSTTLLRVRQVAAEFAFHKQWAALIRQPGLIC